MILNFRVADLSRSMGGQNDRGAETGKDSQPERNGFNRESRGGQDLDRSA